MTEQSIIDRLRIADALRALEFYVIHPDNKGPQFHCRIWDGLSMLGRDKADHLAAKLNEAIREVTEPIRERLLIDAADSLEKLREQEAEIHAGRPDAHP